MDVPLTTLDELETVLGECLLADRRALARRLGGLRRRAKEGKPFDRGLANLAAEIETSRSRRRRRAATVPIPSYPEQLPVSARRAEIAAAIAAHQVVIVAGETGSGKTTQLPKICLELGRGVDGAIGHTQPRRIAARSVAGRIATELDTPLGRSVGYKVRFTDRTSPDSHIRLMTDGILLAEVQSDPLLEQYDTIIIDEAHERSLNIDFLLGYLRRLLPRRPDLKLVVTSATINTEAFARFFDGAPVIEVSGRTYPVDVLYRPVVGEDEDERDRDQPQAIVDAVDELGRLDPLGDILVFLPGEREIRETAEALRKHRLRETEVVPLYSRLTAAEQDRVFQSHAGRRIVLATNVAETSLTVPGIRFVVDTGTARISRYSHRLKVQRLPIEPVAQAAADQRAGRCGRLGPGVCIRLYGEADYQGRPRFTDPEIRRTNLASVILQMANLNLGEVEDFPFIDPPDRRSWADGFRLLHELGAVDDDRRLTAIGRKLVRLPVDPRFGRMLLAAEAERSVDEVLVIASALSVQDPRERPSDAQQQADEKHRRFADEKSDFLAFVNLWRYFHEQAKHLSNSKLRALCRGEFLSYVRLREWHDIHSQLASVAAELKLRHNDEPADYGAVHRALLAGLLSHIAVKGDDPPPVKGKRRPLTEYNGARGAKWAIFPGSSIARKAPKWIVAAELVETARLFGRIVAEIDVAWVERLAGHLVRRNYLEPHWEQKPAQVAAFEQVTLFGLLIVPRRRVNFGPIDPAAAREIFIRHALVQGEYRCDAPFCRHNRKLLEELELIEAKARRRELVVDEAVLYAFYDARVPEGIYSGKSFEHWRRDAERETPQLLFLRREDLMPETAVSGAAFPDHLDVAGIRVPLTYQFEPGSEADGVTAMVPLAALGQLPAGRFDWLVPGLLEEKAVALIKSLPKGVRRNFVPAVNFARAALEALRPSETPLAQALAHELRRMSGIEIAPDAWDPASLPNHLRMRFQVVDEAGKPLIAGRELGAIQRELSGQVREALADRPMGGIEREEVTTWDFGDLPAEVETRSRGMTLRGHPALADTGEAAAVRLFETPEAAAHAHRAGLRRLLALAVADKVKYLRRQLPDAQRLCLLYATVGQCDELKEAIVDAALDRELDRFGELPRDAAAFEGLVGQARAGVVATATQVAAEVKAALEAAQALRRALGGALPPTLLDTAADVKAQFDRLVHAGFIPQTPAAWLPHLPRYLEAARRRLEKARNDPGRDRATTRELNALDDRVYARLRAAAGEPVPELVHLRWLLEELRVSLFAQELKTIEPVSINRLSRRLDELR